MLSMGPTYFLLFLQVVTALLPDLVVKIFEDLRRTSFMKKEQWKVKQIKWRKVDFNDKLEHKHTCDGDQQLETSRRVSNVTLSETTRL